MSGIILGQEAGQQEQARAGVDQPFPDRILLEHEDGQLLLDVDGLSGPARRSSVRDRPPPGHAGWVDRRLRPRRLREARARQRASSDAPGGTAAC